LTGRHEADEEDQVARVLVSRECDNLATSLPKILVSLIGFMFSCWNFPPAVDIRNASR
jgi:hypothetical protein